MQAHEFDEAKLLWKMFYAEQCFKHAQAAAEHILREKLEKEHPLLYPLVTSIYVLYGRPFRSSHGVGRIEEDIIPAEHLDLHRMLLKHRDQIYAHADATGFALPDCGQANHVRVLHLPTEMRLFGTQFHARYPRMPSVIDLCRTLHEKTGYHVTKLFKRYKGRVPKRIGEYAVNVYDQTGDCFTAEKPILLRRET